MKKHWVKIINKLHGNSGETISETLISLLIASLALLMLAGAISAGESLIIRSKNKLDTYYTANEKLANYQNQNGTISISITDNSQSSKLDKLKASTIENVKCYKNNEFSGTPVISYKK